MCSRHSGVEVGLKKEYGIISSFDAALQTIDVRRADVFADIKSILVPLVTSELVMSSDF